MSDLENGDRPLAGSPDRGRMPHKIGLFSRSLGRTVVATVALEAPVVENGWDGGVEWIASGWAWQESSCSRAASGCFGSGATRGSR